MPASYHNSGAGNARPCSRVASGTTLAPVRRAAVLAGIAFALPITCAQPGDGIYNAGVQPSPAGRVNPAEPGFVNDGNHR